MQQVSVPIINNTECEGMFRRAGYVELIPHIFICAGYADGKRDSCEVPQLLAYQFIYLYVEYVKLYVYFIGRPIFRYIVHLFQLFHFMILISSE